MRTSILLVSLLILSACGVAERGTADLRVAQDTTADIELADNSSSVDTGRDDARGSMDNSVDTEGVLDTRAALDTLAEVDMQTLDVAADPWASLRQAVDDSSLENVTLVIGTADGVAFVHEKGDSSVSKVYPLASASKWLSAMVLLKLAEEGVVGLDDHPQNHLAWWTDDPQDPRSLITLEQLMSFTSGFSGDTGLLPGQDGIPCISDKDTTMEDCAQAIYEDNFSYAPGTTYHYGPAHLQIAGAMAVATTGKRWNRLFRDEVGGPLGLALTTAFALPSFDNPRVSGGGTASALDYGRILTALAAGDLLSQDSIDRMTADHTAAPVVMAEVPAAAALDGRSWHYALGCWRECNQPEYTADCDDAPVISSPGLFGFYPWWDRKRGMWGVLATQLVDVQGGSSVTVPLGQGWADLAASALAAD